MSFHVETEVVTASEGSVAEMALERLHACVLPVVAGELVRPGELPVAALPAAAVGLLPRVRPLVRLQVRALRVHLQSLYFNHVEQIV